MGSAYLHGWISLPSEGELLLEHGVPVAVRVGDAGMADVERLIDEIAAVSGLDVTLGGWRPLEDAETKEAALHVDAGEIGEVLRRLAQASAETFFDRYRKPIETDDVDFDDEAYAYDFGFALEVCGLHWNQADQLALRGDYLRALHGAAEEMVRRPPQ